MNLELLVFSLILELTYTELNTHCIELKTMNEELRQYSLDQECTNIELSAQVADLKRQLDNLLNLSEKERKLIQFLRKRKKQY